MPIAADALPEAKIQAKENIDVYAGRTRDRFVSPGLLIGEEYARAYTKAVEWLADQTQPLPYCIQSWADANSWTGLQAATDIKNTGDYWYLLLDQIRDIRIKKKALVDAALSVPEVDQIVADAKTAFDGVGQA